MREIQRGWAKLLVGLFIEAIRDIDNAKDFKKGFNAVRNR